MCGKSLEEVEEALHLLSHTPLPPQYREQVEKQYAQRKQDHNLPQQQIQQIQQQPNAVEDDCSSYDERDLKVQNLLIQNYDPNKEFLNVWAPARVIKRFGNPDINNPNHHISLGNELLYSISQSLYLFYLIGPS